MKKHVIRAPETDRLTIRIPEELIDLTDYASSYAAGRGVATSANTIEAGQVENMAMDTFTELSNVTSTGTVLKASVGGLYLCIVTAAWAYSAPGAPGLTRRVGLSKNGAAAFERSALFANDSAGANEFDDQASFLVRLVPNDTIQPRCQELTGVAADVAVTLEITLVAP